MSLIRHCYAVSRSELLADYQGGSLRRYLADKGLPLTRTYSLIGARLPNREEAARLLMPAMRRCSPSSPCPATVPANRWNWPSRSAAPIASSTRSPLGEAHDRLAFRSHHRRTTALDGRARPRPSRELDAHADALRDADYHLLRAAETGMTLVRGRMGGTGSPFNLGEMTVTRCVVRLGDGRTGYSYVAGRDKRHAELAALADAHLQGADAAAWQARLIEPLARTQAERRAAQEAEIATTKVEFFTLVRGKIDDQRFASQPGGYRRAIATGVPGPGPGCPAEFPRGAQGPRRTGAGAQPRPRTGAGRVATGQLRAVPELPRLRHPLWLAPGLDSPMLRANLAFHCGCPIVAEREQALFACSTKASWTT